MKPIKLEKYGCTDIGHKRPSNEDYFQIEDYIFVLADGMGGHNAGEIASQLAVENTMNYFKELYKKDKFERYDKHQVEQILLDTIIKVNKKVYKKSMEDVHLRGMGTTLVVALHQKPNVIYIANVGDSRAYLFRKDHLKLLSEDHSVTGSLLKNGTITQNEARNHPYRHHLTRSIGNSDKVFPFTHYIKIKSGDKLLLCSDGLWNVLSTNDMIDTFQKDCSCKEICQELNNKAKELQSEDNITSIVIRVS